MNVGVFVGVLFLGLCLLTAFTIWLGRPIDFKKEKEKHLKRLFKRLDKKIAREKNKK